MADITQRPDIVLSNGSKIHIANCNWNGGFVLVDFTPTGFTDTLNFSLRLSPAKSAELGIAAIAAAKAAGWVESVEEVETV